MNNNTHKRKLSAIEGSYFHAPYAIVSLAVTVQGTVSEAALKAAVLKIQARHPNLQRRIIKDEKGIPWFVEDQVGDIPIKVHNRIDDQSWVKAVEKESSIAFDFDQRPPIRVLLIQGQERNDMVLFCHHTICDGLSLAFLARDLLETLGDPSKKLEPLPDVHPIDRENLPVGVKINSIIEFAIKRINQKWAEDEVIFDQEDYQALTEGYWADADHHTLILEFNQEETAKLVGRCKAEGVTVNSALAVALAAAQVEVQGSKPFHNMVAVAGSLREGLSYPVGEGMGIFAGAVTPKYSYKNGQDFWENARRFHKKVSPLYTNQKLFSDLLAWTVLAPGVIESLSFKLAGGTASLDSPRGERLREFSKRDDVISAMVKREKMDNLDSVLIGTALTNLTRLDFPERYGDLVLERMTLKPGGAFPLTYVNLLVGAVTVSGRLSLSLEYSERRLSREQVVQIGEYIRMILLKN